jgi:hypothetical protein
MILKIAIRIISFFRVSRAAQKHRRTLNTLSNCANRLAHTEIDFPVVQVER